MTILTWAAVMNLAATCVTPQGLAPLAAGMALTENPALRTDAINHNHNGTDDIGLTQINEVNLSWLPMTRQDLLDPCKNLQASIMVQFKKYNGNPPPAVARAYVDRAIRMTAKAFDNPIKNPPPSASECQADPWDLWAKADCTSETSPDQ